MSSTKAADRLTKAETDVISWLLVMPLLDRSGLEVLTGRSHGSVIGAVESLETSGLVTSFAASVPGARSVRRLFLTATGIEAAARRQGVPAEALFRRHPVSDHWIRLLTGRLTAVTSIYRFVAALEQTASIQGFRWYRKLPLDAVVEIGDGRMLAVLREGRLAQPSHLGRRLRSLLRLPHPWTVAVLAPDILCLRDWQRLLERLPFNGFLAFEDEVLAADSRTPVWFTPLDRRPWQLGELVSLVRRGEVPDEPRLRRRQTPPSPATCRQLAVDQGNSSGIRNQFLPTALDSGSKRVLDLLALWQWISFRDLQGFLGVSKTRLCQLLDPVAEFGMVDRVRFYGRVRYALSDRGLRYLARQDRLAVQAVMHRWSASPLEPGQPFSWANARGTRSRQLAREIAHTAAIHRFTAAMAVQAAELGGELVEAHPAHRAVRRFTVGGRHLSINPDALYRCRVGDSDRYFFLEWESGAGSVAHFVNKLNPYAAYQSSRQPLADFGFLPAVIFVFPDELVEADFLRVAHERTGSVAAPVPILTSTEPLVRRLGPQAPVWRTRPGGTRTTLREHAQPVTS